jgi:predicted DNA-binding transcriptional regulator YafY
MGRKTATETLAKTLAALLSKRTVVQAALARSISVDSETVARAMRELAEGGVPVVRAVVGRDVEWSVGKNWFPNAVMFERDEATRLLLLLLRLRPSRERDAFVSKLAAAACAPKGSERAERVAIPATTNPPEAEACRLAVEDAVLKRAVIALKYQRSGDAEPTWRTLSPQSTVSADRPYLVALDHSKNELRNYRFDRMHRVMTEERVAFREVPRTRGCAAHVVDAAVRATRCPRARGDALLIVMADMVPSTLSPRTRGCAVGRRRPARGAQVVPAHAGMRRDESRRSPRRKRCPRARGDAP